MKLRFRDVGSALMWSLACAVLALLWTVEAGWFLSAVGAFVGYWVGIGLAHTRVRTIPAVIGVWLFYLLFAGLSTLPGTTAWMAGMMGPEVAYILSQIAGWFFQSFAAVCALRFLSERYPSLVTLEVLTVAMMLASPLAAHRNGYINRPYFVVDPLWSQNRDPVPWFFGIGVLVASALVVLAMGRRTRRSSVLDLFLLLLLLGSIFAFLPVEKLKQMMPPPQGQKQDKDKDEKAKANEKGGKGGQGGKSDKRDNNGFDDDKNMDPPPESSSSQENKPIAVVLLRDDYNPPYGMYYFRLDAFSQYNGRRLVANKADVDLIGDFPANATALQSAGPHTQNAYLHLKTLVALVDPVSKPFGLVNTVAIAPAQNPSPADYVRAYECESEVLQLDFPAFSGSAVGSELWTQDDWKHYTELPDDVRYRQLADKIVSALPPNLAKLPVAKALAIKFYLDRTVTYSTKAKHDGMDDPTADYLFGNQRGYCVHQAHAAVFLMRSLGIPARVGSGYATPSRNRGSGATILLRSGEAHAWPELYVRDLGWVVMDISPEKSDAEPMAPPDPGLQRMLGQKADQTEGKPGKDKAEPPRQSIQQVFRDYARAFYRFLFYALGVALVTIYSIKFFRRFEPLFCGSSRLGVAALRSAVDQMAEVGETRKYGEGRLQFAQRVGYEALFPLTEAHFAATLGKRQVDSTNVLRLREQVHHQIAKKHPWWRRLLGFIDPTSWMRAR